MTIVHPTFAKTKPDNEEDKHFGWKLTPPNEALTN
jgi:hypothetical protein